MPEREYEDLTVRELEDLLERKKKNVALAELLRERDRLKLELRKVERTIDEMERSGAARLSGSSVPGAGGAGPGWNGNGHGGPRFADRLDAATLEDDGEGSATSRDSEFDGEDGSPGSKPSFLAGKRKRNLKDYIAQVLLEAGEPLSPSEIQRRLPDAGYESSSTNPRSFYNTVFQALQRYDIFEKTRKKYGLTEEAMRDNGVKEILPKRKTRLKDFIIEVLDKSESALKPSEIASRVVIAGYDTELGMDELNQRVSATLKKYLNKDFDWDSQRYFLFRRGAVTS